MSISTIVACLVYAFINGWKLSLVVLSFIPILVVASAIQMKVFAGGAVSNDGEDDLIQSGKVRIALHLCPREISLGAEKEIGEVYTQAVIQQ